MFKKYTQILMTGDSVTDCGHARPIGGRNTGLGNGYPSIIDSNITALYPEDKVFCYNTAISGSTTKFLLDNMEEFFIPEKHPDIVTVMIGINNIWRHFDIGTYFPESLLSIDRYEADLNAIADYVTKMNSKLILMTPYFLEKNRSDPMRKMCDAYAEIVRKVASERSIVICDTQVAFDHFLEKATSYIASSDRVHPNAVGHALIAHELMKTFELIV